MKKKVIRHMVLVGIIILLMPFSSLGKSETQKHIEGLNSFILTGSIIDENSNLVLVGYSGRGFEKTPTIVTCDELGNIQWTYEIDSDKGNLYYDIVPVDLGVFAALRYEQGDSFSALDFFCDGTLLSSIESLKNVYRIFRVTDGFIVFSKTDFFHCAFQMIDMNGDIIWEEMIDQPIMIRDLQEIEGAYLAVGYYESDYESENIGIIIELDSAGHTPWCYKSKTASDYFRVFSTSDGFLVIGNTAGPETSNASSVFFKHSDENWSPVETTLYAGRLQCALQDDDTYFVLTYSKGSVTLYQCNVDGKYITSWRIQVDGIENPQTFNLLSDEGEVLLLVNGYTNPYEYINCSTRIVKIIKDS